MFSLPVPAAGCVCSNVFCRQQIQMQRRLLQPWNFDSQWCFQECRVSALVLLSSINHFFELPICLSICCEQFVVVQLAPGHENLQADKLHQAGQCSWVAQTGSALSFHSTSSTTSSVYWFVAERSATGYCEVMTFNVKGTLMKFLKSLVHFAWVCRNFWLFAFHSKFPDLSEPC